MDKPIVDFIGGARPNFMKIHPICREMQEVGQLQPRFIFTGQHTDPVMGIDNFGDMELCPDWSLEIRGESGLPRFADMIQSYHDYLNVAMKPSAVVVVGDTDTTLAGAIVAKRHKIPLIHVEAGLRSNNIDMPEEINRIMVDRISDLLLTPILDGYYNLKREGITTEIVNVGNVMIDSIKLLTENDKWNAIDTDSPDLLVTLHRPINVDNVRRLSDILDVISSMAEYCKIVFPAHPRTTNIMAKHSIEWPEYMEVPYHYLDFLRLLSRSRAVLTDSGGVQTEAFHFGIPCVVLRKESEWANLLRNGAVKLAGIKTLRQEVTLALNRSSRKNHCIQEVLWDGLSRRRIAYAIYNYLKRRV